MGKERIDWLLSLNRTTINSTFVVRQVISLLKEMSIDLALLHTTLAEVVRFICEIQNLTMQRRRFFGFHFLSSLT